MHHFLKRTWADINMDAIDHNFRAIRNALKPGVKMCCVVKADAYGHGGAHGSPGIPAPGCGLVCGLQFGGSYPAAPVRHHPAPF